MVLELNHMAEAGERYLKSLDSFLFHPFVYVLKEGLTFEKRPVRLESLDAGQMLVLEGLEEGETIIADGGIYLSR